MSPANLGMDFVDPNRAVNPDGVDFFEEMFAVELLSPCFPSTAASDYAWDYPIMLPRITLVSFHT